MTKVFPGTGPPAVDAVSFAVQPGTICMLVGTSGSGKTTLLRMVNRLGDPTSGQVLINGVPTTEQNTIALRRGIGYVIQQVGLFPHLTIEDNVRVVPSIMGRSARQTNARVDELLELVGLDPRAYRKRYPRQLSGGQQQRVGLARALAADPPILLMDEPFGALDAITRGHMQEELRRLQTAVHKTIVFVTHDVDEALRLGDQIAVLSQGRLVQVGSPIELLANPATEFVGRLVGADNALRRFEFLPCTLALEPPAGRASERIEAGTSLLRALMRLIESGAPALAVGDDEALLGEVTLESIVAALRAGQMPVAAGPAVER